ncbi:MAG TPA: hypothetical protein VI754_12600 [Bacteriovoracaceae bacterium]|nr:hypothetical protein [Bacteriovoracaceae bacterium]
MKVDIYLRAVTLSSIYFSQLTKMYLFLIFSCLAIAKAAEAKYTCSTTIHCVKYEGIPTYAKRRNTFHYGNA